MDPTLSILAPLVIAAIGYLISAVKTIKEGRTALVERFGRYKRTLSPGVNFIIPGLDYIVADASTKEQVYDIDKIKVITQDRVEVTVDSLLYWKIVDIKKAIYNIEDVQDAIQKLVLTTVRGMVSNMTLDQVNAARRDLSKKIKDELKEAGEQWGIQITKVELQEISPSEQMRKTLEKQRVAQAEKEAIGLEVAAILDLLKQEENIGLITSDQVLQLISLKKSLEMMGKVAESSNTKLVFMDPKMMRDPMSMDMIGDDYRGRERRISSGSSESTGSTGIGDPPPL